VKEAKDKNLDFLPKTQYKPKISRLIIFIKRISFFSTIDIDILSLYRLVYMIFSLFILLSVWSVVTGGSICSCIESYI
jgi:hypothetical protein